MSLKAPGLGAGGLASLANYESGSFTATLTGCTTSPTGTITYTKYGNMVTLAIPSISGTSNTTAATLTGIPAAIAPAQNQRLLAGITDNGTIAAGVARIDAAGNTITMFPSAAGGAFTSSGTKGIAQNTLTYSLVGG